MKGNGTVAAVSGFYPYRRLIDKHTVPPFEL
jgi:hypothetical protein